MKTISFFLIFIIFQFQPVYLFCQSGKKKITKEDYIKKYCSLAIAEMKRTGVPASITLAQGIHESDCGNSKLATEANNHFGVKCHTSWAGEKIYKDDDQKNECFRKYKTVDESYRDHSDFLTKTKRYAFLFELKPTDYKAWANGLKKAGYATNPKYPELIISIIEENNLNVFDKGITHEKKNVVAENYIEKITHEINKKNRVEYITIKKGDTFYKLAEEFDHSIRFLHKCNDMDKDDVLKEGQIFYLDKKRNRAERGTDFHIVKKGETMQSISQIYGIKLRKLYRKNNLKKGFEVKAGEKLWLRKKKPK